MVLKWLLKKLASSEHSTHGFCSRRKIVSGFGLGIGATLFVLTLILLSQSFKASFLSPIFQGFNNLSGNSSLVSWPFLFSNASLSPPPDLLNSMDLMPLNDKGRGQEKTHEANASKTSQNAFLLDPNGVENLREKIHPGNSSEKGKNESFSNQRLGEETPRGNFSEDVKNASFSNQGDGIGKTREGKSVGDVATGNFSGKSEGFIMNAHVGQSGVNETNNVRNVSDDGPDVHSLGKDERFSTTTLKGNLSDKDHMASFSGLVKKADGSLQCDIFDGKWVRDDTMPYYPPGSCPFIDRDFDCHLNGRPDDEFLRWRWQPNRCDVPRLNSTDFLERLRGKRLVFVGDSLNRNMWESLVCILRHGVADKSRVYEISGRREFKKKGFYAFRYEDYNCSIDFVDAPFLVRESSFKGKNKPFETLRLDLMDRTAMMYHEADVLVFNTGHWWTHEKTSRGEGYYQEGNYVHPKLKVMVAYKKALTTWARWIDKNIDPNKTQVFFRGYSVTHFRGGQWNSGGQCHRETEPIFNETYLAKYPSKMRALEHVLQEMRTPIIYLNISRLTDYRKDGHPSIYRKEYKTVNEKIAAERSQDCSHWCLPGVPDTWNNLLYISLLITGKGSWRN